MEQEKARHRQLTNDEAGTLLLFELLPQLFELTFDCLSRLLEGLHPHFFIWARRPLFAPHEVDKVLRNRYQILPAFLSDFLGQLTRIRLITYQDDYTNKDYKNI